jgi:N-acetylmuramoyl-L-alanine amidase
LTIAASAPPLAAVPPPVFVPTAPPAASAPSPAAGLAAPTAAPAAPLSPDLGAPTRAVVTSVALGPQDDGVQIRVTVNGAAAYEWHRLADFRWYVDIKNATLTDAGRDERPPGPAVDSVRIRQTGSPDAPYVRIALTLRGEKRVDLTPTADGLLIVAANADAVAAVRTGAGRTGSTVALEGSAGTASAAPVEPQPLASATPFWKFTPSSRIIVIDPGHGGSDHGTEHNGLVEKTITLDIARRLRAILAAQGWTVRMTRDSDIDPVSADNLAAMRADGKPNPDDRAYLQTRSDVANSVSARMFISIHVNYSPSSSINGMTFYWYKPEDLALAQAMERAVIPAANINDIGTRHENLYVIRHATVPAVLIETAFISNPGDVQLLASPTFLENVARGIANGVRSYAGAAPVQASQADR